ncbi:nuclear transport factor 2 family protein [Dyadobacter psychrotolerans]|uniref:Nuclear transport factor 2 family protein n=1 Tax=Dyadobacter psychrotolerans TaxID=2541721 RepID=A0A4R5DTH5_9BACT|nr:nuclear transport factor 2 family protein [Dyadobacter psychrotolerans]TDE14435.1 nuclear transport factor 2 family protein [Dyadobacter psychrotolerans]
MPYQHEIAAVEERLMQAVKHGDQRALEDMLSDKLLFIDKNGQITTCSTDLETYRSGELMIRHTDIHDKQINLTGNTAMVMVIERIRGRYRGKPFEGRYLYMRVWKRKKNCWKIAAASCSAMPVIEF